MNATDGLPVSDLVAVIKNAIKQANISITDTTRDLQVTAVYLKLSTIATITTGGRLDFRIPFLGMKLNLGGTVTRQETHTMEMTLIPQPPATMHQTRDSTVESALVEAIETVRAVMIRAAAGDDPFTLQDGNVELAFAVTEDGTISFGIAGELKDEITHIMRLSLATPNTPPKP